MKASVFSYKFCLIVLSPDLVLILSFWHIPLPGIQIPRDAPWTNPLEIILWPVGNMSVDSTLFCHWPSCRRNNSVGGMFTGATYWFPLCVWLVFLLSVMDVDVDVMWPHILMWSSLLITGNQLNYSGKYYSDSRKFEMDKCVCSWYIQWW